MLMNACVFAVFQYNTQMRKNLLNSELRTFLGYFPQGDSNWLNSSLYKYVGLVIPSSEWLKMDHILEFN